MLSCPVCHRLNCPCITAVPSCGAVRHLPVPFPHSVVVLLNSSSGERRSYAYVRRFFARTFGDDHVVSLFHPHTHKVDFDAVKEVLVRVRPRVVIAAGGDGTVSLALSITHTLRASGDIGPCEGAVAVVPTGTCNDLSRVLGYGPGYFRIPYHGRGPLKRLIGRVYRGRPVPVDQYRAHFTLVANAREMCGRVRERCAHEPAVSFMCLPPEQQQQQQPYQPFDHAAACSPYEEEKEGCTIGGGQVGGVVGRLYPPLRSGGPSSLVSREWDGPVFTNYLTTGFDAEVLHDFNEFRKRHASLCSMRLANYLVYGVCGLKSMFCTSSFPSRRVHLCIDGRVVQIPHSAKSVEINSMPCFAGGVVLWSDRRRVFRHPSISDSTLEVSALNGPLNFLGCMLHLCKATKLGQGRHIELRVPACSFVQYDGEILEVAGAYYDDLIIQVSHERQSIGWKVDRTFMKRWEDKFASYPAPQ